MINNDTIAGISTAMSPGGIGIVRISGSDAVEITSKIFVPYNKKKKIENMETYTASYGYIVDEEEEVDECIVLFMKGPNSYTREDVIEIDCHGGVIVLNKILSIVVKHGARPAEPGEFTKRAFLNGRIDLSQAEAVMDIIHSKNNFALKSSLKQLKGNLKNTIVHLRDQILYEIAYIESALDDPEHISLEGYGDRCEQVVKACENEIAKLLENADNGRILKEGIKTCIVGKPNVGKSSLLNIFAGEERAIVTEIAGTTRDILEESVTVHGIPLLLLDTAGIRETDNVVEQIGIKRAKESMEDADLVLYVIDSSVSLEDMDYALMEEVKDKNVIVLMNKTDLEKKVSKEEIYQILPKDIVEISAKNEDGIDALYELLKNRFFEGNIDFNSEVYITNTRHKYALQQAQNSLKLVENSLESGMPEDFLSIDLMDAYTQLGYIIGEEVEDDLVNKIFKEFCMGK